MSAQDKLLYAIQNKRFYRVGATQPTNVDVRILSATNQDLWKAVREGRFREDLYYRINVFSLRIPPLRERISDLYLLSRSLTESVCAQYGIPPKSSPARQWRSCSSTLGRAISGSWATSSSGRWRYARAASSALRRSNSPPWARVRRKPPPSSPAR